MVFIPRPLVSEPVEQAGAPPSTLSRFYGAYLYVLNSFQTPFLLLIRLLWGYGFILAGKDKFSNFDKSIEAFTNLGIPFPEFNMVLTGVTEYFGGFLLIIGLGTRLISFPLFFAMCVAYATAHHEALLNIIDKPSVFYNASPFTYLTVCIILMLFGPGRASIDHLISCRYKSLYQKEFSESACGPR